MGTWRYMSPEQMRNDATIVDQRSDVYSLGATLYELLVGQPAFGAADGHRVMQQVLETEPTGPRKISSQIPRELEVICLKVKSAAASHTLSSNHRFCSAPAPSFASSLSKFERMWHSSWANW